MAAGAALERLAYIESLRTPEPKQHHGTVAAEQFRASRQKLTTDAARRIDCQT